MTALNLNPYKVFVSVALMLASFSLTTGCSKDKSSRTAVVRSRTVPSDPNLQSSIQTNNWGVIGHNGQSVLSEFMFKAEVGFVSQSYYDNTGIRFKREGNQVYLLVWDDRANQEGAFYWPLQIQDKQCNSSRASVTVSDAVGSVTLSGQFFSGLWSGTVQFQNTEGGASGTLGDFEIGQSQFFQSGCN